MSPAQSSQADDTGQPLLHVPAVCARQLVVQEPEGEDDPSEDQQRQSHRPALQGPIPAFLPHI